MKNKELFNPTKILFEPNVLNYELGRDLLNKYNYLPREAIERHDRIQTVRDAPDSDFPKFKNYLILGERKTFKFSENSRSADYLVPFTSSGCSAMCMYCYLVCNFFKSSFLRIFVNRDQIFAPIIKKAEEYGRLGKRVAFELGSNSDMVLEDSISGSLEWAIEKFAAIPNAECTFATKFSQVDSLLSLNHNGHTRVRLSLNPDELIRKVEFRTSNLTDRLIAAQKLFNAGYKVGINIAPVILVPGWKDLYNDLLIQIKESLSEDLLRSVFFEIIFMTYGYAHIKINEAAFPNSIKIFDKDKMRVKGRGKYCYKQELIDDGREFFSEKIKSIFPEADISYII